jgi:two-component system response regulator FixJ
MPDERVVHIAADDADFRLSLEALLQQAGFATISYETAASVLGRVVELTTGCMLLDVHLPGMDGLEPQARLNKLNVDLPVIVMTGRGDIATAVRAMKAGSVDFIEKPFDDEPLLQAIEAALGRASRDRTIAKAVALLATLSPREREVLDASWPVGRPR